jgi:hypothetical protein
VKSLQGTKRRRLGLAALALCTILLPGCGLRNNNPVISSLEAGTEPVKVSGNSELKCVASDPDGDELIYEWRATDGNISGTGLVTIWRAPQTPGTYEITVTVTDGSDGEATMQLPIEVIPNHHPVIESLTAEHLLVKQDESTTVTCVASDPDGDKLTYEWKTTDGALSGQGSAVTWTAPSTCYSAIITVTVADDWGGRVREVLSIEVELEMAEGGVTKSKPG